MYEYLAYVNRLRFAYIVVELSSIQYMSYLSAVDAVIPEYPKQYDTLANVENSFHEITVFDTDKTLVPVKVFTNEGNLPTFIMHTITFNLYQ